MKKAFILLPAALMLLAGCNDKTDDSSSVVEEPKKNQVADILDSFGEVDKEITFQAYYLGSHVREGDKGGYAYVGSGDRAIQLYSPKQAMVSGLSKGDLVSVTGQYGIYSGMPQVTMNIYDKKTKSDKYTGKIEPVAAADADTMEFTAPVLEVKDKSVLVAKNLGLPMTAKVKIASDNVTEDSRFHNKDLDVALEDGTELHVKADSRDIDASVLAKIVGEKGAELTFSGYLSYYENDIKTVAPNTAKYTFSLFTVA